MKKQVKVARKTEAKIKSIKKRTVLGNYKMHTTRTHRRRSGRRTNKMYKDPFPGHQIKSATMKQAINTVKKVNHGVKKMEKVSELSPQRLHFEDEFFSAHHFPATENDWENWKAKSDKFHSKL